ncbi:MAG: chemotaxis protein CheC [Chloroflexota bacterium]
MSQQAKYWFEIINSPQSTAILQAAMDHTAGNLSSMVGRPITIEVLKVETLPISQVTTIAGAPETETVGIYLMIDGDLTGQAVLMLLLTEALCMVDLLMDLSPGTTTSLEDLERSALAEVGNVTLAGFLNEIAKLTGLSARPSPPMVIIDMLGAILNVVLTPVAIVSDEVFIVETIFREDNRVMRAHFWVLPEPTVVTFGKVSVHPITRAKYG